MLTPTARTSPTLWSHMRLCSLRAALSINPDVDSWVLHSPRAWLGTAFHRLMAGAPGDSSEAASLWDGAIAKILADASRHRLDARFANPERWPGYYLVRQRAIASAVGKGGGGSGVRRRGSPGSSPPAGGSERLLTARSGRLAGRPDQFDSSAVTEYKSTLPDPVRADAASIVDGYWRQLRLYAVLIGEMGSWPATARVVAASGQVLEQPVDRPACEAEADAAISGLDAMNQALSTGCDSAALASPGQVACGQCPYMAICPAFWSWCEANPWPELLEPAARGTLLSIDPGMDGDLYAVNVSLIGRYGVGGDQSLALRKSVHGDLTGLASGSQLRVVFANLRPDGRLRADASTCVFSEAEIPELRCGSV
ncbi:PD-(D/E)XK nuclease family protein [Bradyrhizobium cenepequi]